MDRPVLHTFVRELADDGRLAEFAEALPTRARVSEAALPVVLAALHERLERPLVCLLAEDADARDAAEAAAWFLGDEAVGFLPGRGVRWESGLEAPPHLVGERACRGPGGGSRGALGGARSRRVRARRACRRPRAVRGSRRDRRRLPDDRARAAARRVLRR